MGHLSPKEKTEQSDRAVAGILNKAYEMIGPIQKPYRQAVWSAEEIAQTSQHLNSVELDIEATLGQPNREPQYEVRYPLDQGLVLIIDSSLSIKGEKLAFLAAMVATVALSVPARALAVLAFDSEIHRIKKFSESASNESDVREWVRRLLSIPPGGFTNLSLGLTTAKQWIAESTFPQARSVLISDGRITEGSDPIAIAKTMRFLHSIKLGRDPEGRTLMRDIATVGSGQYFEVREFSELPRVLFHGLRSWVR